MKAPRPEHHTARRYEVRHVTRYAYQQPVTASYGRACLRPRETAEQRILSHRVDISPDPSALTEHIDLHGNFTHYLELRTPHTELVVDKLSIIESEHPVVDLADLDRWTVAEAAAPASVGTVEAPADPVLLATYLLPSPLVTLDDQVRRVAADLFPADRPLGRALDELVTRIHDDFEYRKGATSVRTTIPELLATGAGVCQDFAHLAVGVLRCQGFPARYVSGYLETRPPPGKPKLKGSDATHAWASVRVPDGRWIDLDPTNNTLADSRYLVTAWGRDFTDVSPLKGVIYSEGARSKLSVAVDVTRLDQEFE